MENQTRMIDPPQRDDSLAHLQMLEVLHGPTTFKVHHPAHGACVLERFFGASAREVAERKRAVLARLHAKGDRPGFRRPVSLARRDDVWLLLTTFVEGVSLKFADREPFRASPRAAAAMGAELLERVAVLHSMGVAHGSVDERHVIVGPALGLVGISGEPLQGGGREDVCEVARIVYRHVTGRDWTASAPPVCAFRDDVGTALDQWLEAVREGQVGALDARYWLLAVAATLPERGRRARPSALSLRPPSCGRIESLTPPSSEMQARMR